MGTQDRFQHLSDWVAELVFTKSTPSKLIKLSAKKLLQARLLLRAFRTTDMGCRHINQVATTKSGDLNMPVHAQDPFLDRRRQHEIWATVGPQDLRDRTD